MVDVCAAGAGGTALSRPRISLTSLFRRNRFDLSLFVYELLALLRAGLALTEALETLDERWRQNRPGATAEEKGHYVLPELTRLMQQGKSFSVALAAHPDCFSPLFVAMVAASEQTGEMMQALERYLQYHGQVSVVRQKIIAASLYPAMLLLSVQPFSGERTPAIPGGITYCFPAKNMTAPTDGELALRGLLAGDDARFAYALCGVF